MTSKAALAPDFLTLDIEEWYMANYDGIAFQDYASLPSRIDWELDRLLEICHQYDIKATCFWVGRLAAQRPDLVRKFHRAGHEIASHGHDHELVHRMTPEEFRADLCRSIKTLEDCTGAKVEGFRAPSWSVKADTVGWFYPVLEQAGIAYSSSVYPARTYLFGIEGFPERVHRPQIGVGQTAVYEIPQQLTTLAGRKIGFSGGFFLRAFPVWFINRTLTRKNLEGKPVSVYLHPRELDPEAPRLPLKGIDRLVHYWNIGGTEGKLRRILSCKQFRFITMSEFIKTVPGYGVP